MYERRIDRAKQATRGWLMRIGRELREARVAAGLTQREIGRHTGLSHTEVGRIERGLVPSVPYSTVAAIAAAVGLAVPLRAYPDGDAVRDAGQLALLRRFRALVSPRLRHRTEVPIGSAGDGRAWDEVIEGDGWSIPAEAESRIRDTQALRRRLAIKCRDGHVQHVLLIVADTRHNRNAMREARDDFAEAFPLTSRQALAALRRGERPAAGAIIFA